MKSIWKRVGRYFGPDYAKDAENNDAVSIIVWKTNHRGEVGREVAVVDYDANVTYIDERAKTDPVAQEYISDARFRVFARKAYLLYLGDRNDKRNFGDFKENEFFNEECMKNLLNENGFLVYREIMKWYMEE